MADRYTVRIIGSDAAFQCKPGESILAGMERAGVKKIFTGCRRGGCGVCIVQVHGSFKPVRRMSREYISEQDEGRGRVLACCVSPSDDIEIEIL